MPSLKILKRPTSGSTSPSATAEDKAAKAALQAKNLKDREKAYLEARKKIFGSEEASAAASNAALLPPPMPGSPKVDSAEVSENDDGSVSASTGLKHFGKRSVTDGQRQQQLHRQKGKASPASPAVKATGLVEGEADPLASSTGSLELPRSVTALSRPTTRPTTPTVPTFGQKLIREPRHPPSSKDHNGQPVRGFGRTEEQEIAEGQPALVPASTQPKRKKNKNKNKKASGEEQLSVPEMENLSVQDTATMTATSAEEKERKKIALSAAAQAFVPKGLVPARVADRSPRPASPAPVD